MEDLINNPNIKGEVVYAKKKGESTPCYIPFSKDSGDNPIIATEQYVQTVQLGKSFEYEMKTEMRLEPRGYRELHCGCVGAREGDFVLVGIKGANPNLAEFTVTGIVSYKDNVSARIQNITDKQAVFPACTVTMKLLKF